MLVRIIMMGITSQFAFQNITSHYITSYLNVHHLNNITPLNTALNHITENRCISLCVISHIIKPYHITIYHIANRHIRYIIWHKYRKKSRHIASHCIIHRIISYHMESTSYYIIHRIILHHIRSYNETCEITLYHMKSY